MKKVFVVLVSMMFVISTMGLAIAKEEKKPKPDATLTMSEGQVAVGIGYSWGKGVLTYKGKKTGISLSDCITSRFAARYKKLV